MKNIGGSVAEERDASGHNSGSAPAIMVAAEAVRSALIRMTAVVAALALLAFPAADDVIRCLKRLTGADLVAFGVADAFLAVASVALWMAVFAAVPLMVHEALKMVHRFVPAFSPSARWAFGLAAVSLFYLGVAFCVRVTLPFGSRFLLDFQSEHLMAAVCVRQFVGFCLVFCLGFGSLFELPLAMILAARLGLASAGQAGRCRRWAVLAITVVAAVVTPTPDLVNLGLLAVPMYILFEIGILGMRLFGRSRVKRVRHTGPDVGPVGAGG